MSALKSPILHFVIIGVVAFVAYTHLKPADRETIHITTQTIDALIQQRESITQNTTTPAERQILIEGHIEDEILLREVYKRGFDKNDYRVPVIAEIGVEKQKLPVISILLFLAAFGLLMFSIRPRKLLLGRPVLLGVVALGLVLYPFVSFPVDPPFASQWKPSTERTAIILDGLLTNVYRAFDVRDENRVYDRLAMSVIGEQLTQIYLQNRRSLELENRGGARANVDGVDILAINKVTQSEADGFIADAVWTVSGSVSHFGHTHYRRNRNHALVTFVVDEDSWKIKDIELIDEKRLL